MRILTIEEYINYYNKYKRFPNGAYVNRDKTLNEKQLKSKYDEYVKSMKRQEDNNIKLFEKKKEQKLKVVVKKDEKWEECKKIVWERDKSKCKLLSITTQEDLIKYQLSSLLYNNTFSQLDVAHVFSRGAYPHMKYETDNMVLLSRAFHSRLDSYCDPFTGKSISKEEHTLWWENIVGDEMYDKLLELSKNK